MWQAKGKSGERLVVIPPYGYRKDPENSKKLIVDEENATNVRRIFRLSVEGLSPAQIVRQLNGEYFPNPSAYKYEHGILLKPRHCKDPYFWNTTTIHKILDTPEYLEDIINFKTWTKSYKDKKCHWSPLEKQLVFEHTQPAIIDPETWEIVCQMQEHKRRAPCYSDSGQLYGVSYCSELREQALFSQRTIYNEAWTKVRYYGAYSCSENRKDVQYLQHRKCTCHYITESALEQIVLEELWEILQFVSRNEKRFVRLVMDNSRQEQSRETVAKKRAVSKHHRRISEIDILIERLYEYNVSGKVPDQAKGDRHLKVEIIYNNISAVDPQSWAEAGSHFITSPPAMKKLLPYGCYPKGEGIFL